MVTTPPWSHDLSSLTLQDYLIGEITLGNGNRRNQICHCGSGKKYKNCCWKKDNTLRQLGFTFKVDKPTVITGGEISPDGRVRLMSGNKPINIKNVNVTEWKETKTKLRIKSSIPTNSSEPFFDPELMLANSRYVFGCDTNTLTVCDRKINICCITCATRLIKPDGFEGSIQQIFCVDFDDSNYTAERIGWIIAIQSIQKSLNRANEANEKVIICTDHDLQAISDINTRKQPIIPGYALPKNMELFYAADRGSTVQNKVVSSAHKGASRVGTLIANNPLPAQIILPNLLGETSNSIRRWQNESNSHLFFN